MTRNRSYKPLVRVFTLCFLFLFINCAFAQEDDSTDFYKKIKDAAFKRTFTKWLYYAIFVDPGPRENPMEPKIVDKHPDSYLPYKKQIIKKINVTVYNPFGHKVEDTIHHFDNHLEDLANHIHINTRKWIIINKLLFKENDTLNPLQLTESERLLRLAAYINDARIYVAGDAYSDSVEVNVEIKDKWAITAPFKITPQGGSVSFRNQNLFGIGQQFEQHVAYKMPDFFNYGGYYSITNLDNTYISTLLSYEKTDNATSVSLSFDRSYYSPLATWGGGLFLGHTWSYFPYKDTVQDLNKKLPLNSLNYDVWFGKSFKLKKIKTLFNQATNIISGVRYYNTSYLARPSFNIDSSKSNFNSFGVIGNLGFSVQQYYKDQYIYRFGSNEDVPEGLIIQGTYGASKREFKDIRYYLGAEVARAKKFRIGYITSTLSYGIFFNKVIANDITTKFNLYYLSNLWRKGKWRFREFLNYTIVDGENKVLGESITLKSDELYGFNSGPLTGKTKMILNFETVAYAPCDLVGFRFAGIAMVGLGIIGSPQRRMEISPLYQAYSLGLLIRNEHLVSSTFQVSIGLYPYLPDGRTNVFMFNPVTSFTLRVRTFSMGRPEFISY